MDFLVAGLVVGLIVGVWLYSRGRARGSTSTPAARTPRSGETYVALRHQGLHRSRAELGVPKPSEASEPWGVLMETGYEKASATVVAFSDGNASIYLSTGGGFIGGAGREPVRQAAINMVRVAGPFVSQMTPTKTFPLPDRGRTIFYLRTDEGVLTGGATEEELGKRRHPLAPLFFAGQDVITQYRLLDPKK